MTEPSGPPTLRFSGSKFFAQRLVLSTLTGRTIRISNIRATSKLNPGVRPYEVSLLRLLEDITTGSRIEISFTGTTVVYKPGLLKGNKVGLLRHATRCELPADVDRGVSYFLLPLCLLAPFAKTPVSVVFCGAGCVTAATTRTGDVSVDTVRTAILPLYARFGMDRDIELRVLKRAAAGVKGHGGGGEVELVFGHQVRLPKTLHLLSPGRVKRIRGVAYSMSVAGANNARMIETARGVLNRFCPDTYVFSDVSSAPMVEVEHGRKAGTKRRTGVGFGISLVAESSTGCLYSADVASPPEGGVAAEDLGRQCAMQLLEVLEKGGCVSPVAAQTVITLMTMGSEDVGRVRIGREVLATEEVLGLGRDLRSFGASGWGLRDAEGSEAGDGQDVIVSIVGRGVGNVGKKVA